MDEKPIYTVVFCPKCGRRYPVRIYHNGQPIKYNLRCTRCKTVSEVEIK